LFLESENTVLYILVNPRKVIEREKYIFFFKEEFFERIVKCAQIRSVVSKGRGGGCLCYDRGRQVSFQIFPELSSPFRSPPSPQPPSVNRYFHIMPNVAATASVEEIFHINIKRKPSELYSTEVLQDNKSKIVDLIFCRNSDQRR